MNKQQYIEQGGRQCSHCESRYLTRHIQGHINGAYYVTVVCNTCKARWTDEYTLTATHL